MTEPQAQPQEPRTAFWDLPWGWSQAVLVQVCLIGIAFAFQWRLNGMELPAPPAGLLIPAVLVYTLAVFGLGWRFRKFEELLWASGVPFGMTALVFTGALALTSTLFIQDIDAYDIWTRLGLRRVFQSLPFLMAASLLWFNLAALLGRRCASRRLNMPFFLNHFGMLCVLAGSLVGSQLAITGSLRMLTGHPVNSVQTDMETGVPLGASINVIKHTNRMHPPILTLSKPALQFRNEPLVLGPLKEGSVYTHRLGDQSFTIRVVRRPGTILPPLTDDRFLEYTQCFQVKIASAKQGERLEYLPAYLLPAPKGPITQTSFTGPSTVTRGPDGHMISVPFGRVVLPDGSPLPEKVRRQMQATQRFYAMTPRIEARQGAFADVRTQVEVITRDGQRLQAEMAVNKPLRVNGWTLFQNGGTLTFAGNHLVTFLARKDPTQPVLLLGMLMILVGSILAYAARLRGPETTV